MELQSIDLKGSPTNMGQGFGEACRSQVHELYHIRLDTAITCAKQLGRTYEPDDLHAISHRCIVAAEVFDPIGHAEFLGIAEGAGLTPEELFVANALTDLRDVLGFHAEEDLEGCTSFVVPGKLARKGQTLIGENWDLHTTNMPYVRLVHRYPDNAPATHGVTLTGCLSLMGMNEHGIAIGNTNLRTCDVRIGVQYLSIIHRVLRARTRADALRIIEDAPRAAAHYYFLSDGNGSATCIECSGYEYATTDVESDICIHANHVNDHALRDLERPYSASSEFRQSRLDVLMRAGLPDITVDHIKEALSDHEGGSNCICRHDVTPGISTDACVIMCPESGELHACRGQAHVGEWVTVQCRS